MKLLYPTQQMRRTLDHPVDCIRTYGADRASTIMRRLGQIRAASSLAELMLLSGRFHLLKGNLSGHFAANISPNYRLILRAYHDPLPTTPDGGLDCAHVTTCLVVEIGDYHGS